MTGPPHPLHSARIRWVPRAAMSVAIVLAWALPGIAAAVELPQGEGVELVRLQCGICHNLDLVAQQRLSRSRWSGVLDDMIRFGAPFDSAQGETLLNYLAARLGQPRAAGDGVTAGALPAGAGADLVRLQCGICHDLDLVRAQRLSRDVWEEVLADMLNYGAVFDDAQGAAILDYLAEHLGP